MERIRALVGAPACRRWHYSRLRRAVIVGS
nr:MAG TPA_asm: hypothetical protein [Caudoviricetes sp.]